MFCSRCGVSLAEGAQFCVDCGHMVDETLPAASMPANVTVCSNCSKSILPGANFCANCGNAAPPVTIISIANGNSAAAAAAAYEPVHWQRRRPSSSRKIVLWLLVLAIVVAFGWLVTADNSIASQLKAYLITEHAETITEGSVTLKPHGFVSYRVSVPEGAIDVAVTGQFDASGRAENDIQALLLTDSEFVVWQSGYATSPFYDSGKVSQGNLQAGLPARAGTYYLIFSNKPSRVEKTVHVMAGLRYDTWLPDPLVYLKQKIWGWFE